MSNTWVDDFYSLNPDAIAEDEVKKGKEYKNDLFGSVIPALDRRDKKYYGRLTDEQKKDISIWTLTRWMSSTPKDSLLQIWNVNTVANVNSKFLTKHKELQWMLLAMTGPGKPTKHEWIAAPKGVKKNKLEEALLVHYPLLRDAELELLMKLNTREDFEAFFKDNGYDDKAIKELFKGDSKGK